MKRRLFLFVWLAACAPPGSHAPQADAGALAAPPLPRPAPIPPPALGPMPSPDAGFPSANECKTDSDCAIVPDWVGCCPGSAPGPVATRYIDAHRAWAQTHCNGFVCPALGTPGPAPPVCFMTAMCRDGQCGTACNERNPIHEHQPLPIVPVAPPKKDAGSKRIKG
jgi:hypothetical protein